MLPTRPLAHVPLLLTAFVTVGLGAAPVAHADAVSIAPPIALKGVDEERVFDVFSLISSELEFMEGVDEVIEIDPSPPALDVGCLDSTRCLGAITSESQGDVLLAGTLEELGSDLVLDLAYYDVRVNRVLRRKSYTLPGDPSGLIDAITPVLVEALTGQSPAQERAQQDLTGVGFDDDLSSDDLGFEPGRTGTRPPATTPPPSRSAGTTRTVDRAITPPPMPPSDPPAEDFDPSAISFGSSAEDISFGSSADEITFEEPPPPPPRREEPAPRYEDPYEDTYVDRYEEEPLDLERDRRSANFDRDRSRADLDRPTRSSTSKSDTSTDDWRRVHIAVRGGFLKYGLFNFGDVSGEIQVRTVDGLFIAAGADLAIVRRAQPQSVIDDGGPPVVTNFIVPAHFGLLYRFKPGKFQPYAGADAILAQYYRDPETGRGAIAFGARARGGFDYLFSRNFGVNVDVAMGFWLGDQWPQVDQRLPTLGFLPYVGAGFVFAF